MRASSSFFATTLFVALSFGLAACDSNPVGPEEPSARTTTDYESLSPYSPGTLTPVAVPDTPLVAARDTLSGQGGG